LLLPSPQSPRQRRRNDQPQQFGRRRPDHREGAEAGTGKGVGSPAAGAGGSY
jgi:hypothetical protein